MMGQEKTTAVMFKETTFFQILAKHTTLLAIGVMILAIFIDSFLAGALGVIGEDPDDVMRLVQIKDYLAGQSWFDTNQYRMGLAGGTDMHWSRIPDIPVILMTRFFDIFLPHEQALIWAFTIWPPLSASILIGACFVASKYWGGKKTKVFIFILLLVFLLKFNRFTPGAIDHHNLQIGFVTLSMAFAMDKEQRFKSYFISGFAAATSIAIGVEVYLFIAVICAYMALHWIVTGKAFAAAAQGFGIGFSITLILLFFVTIAPSNYGVVYCDALSVVTVIVGVIGALGLALLTKIGSSFSLNDSFLRRILAMSLLAVICATILLTQAPQCLVNPLDSLPDEVSNLWLNNISEAKPLYDTELEVIPFYICVPIIALLVLVFEIGSNILRPTKSTDLDIIPLNESASVNLSGKILVLMLLVSAIMLMVHQVRFYPFAHVFTIVPLANWVGNIYVKTKLKNPASVVYLAALTVSVPLSWAVMTSLTSQTPELSEDVEKSQEDCSAEDVVDSLRGLPIGVILAGSDMTGLILNKTEHRAISGNYHRNWEGISTEIQVGISEPVKAGEILYENNIDYLYHCSQANVTQVHINHSKTGLSAQLFKGKVPDYLELVSSPDIGNGTVKIFTIKRPDYE